MKKTITFAAGAVLVSAALFARENLLDGGYWQRDIARPAVGTLESTIIPTHADSVLHAAVRYGTAAEKPLATFSRTFHNMVPKRYLFGAWVQITRPDAAVALEVRGAGGTVLSTISVNTATDVSGALTPGRWTPVEVEADLSACDAATLRSVTFAIAPQWTDGSAVTGETLPDIYINDAYLYGINSATGSYDAVEVANGSFGMWDGDGLRTPRGWTGSATRCAGAHITDDGAALEAGASLQMRVAEKGSRPYRISFKARADQPTNITVDNMAPVVVQPGGWQSFSLEWHGNHYFTFEGDAPWQLDEVRYTPIYDIDHPRPAERTLHVTSSADDGPGSLREAVAESATGDLICIDVDEVNLLSTIDLSDRSITIQGHRVPFVGLSTITIAEGQRAFYINPTLEGTTLHLKDLTITGANTTLPGSAIYVGDSRATGTVDLILTNVWCHYCKSTQQGGALYVNAPGAKVTTRERTAFRCCEAPSGSAVCFAGGRSMTLDYSFFEGCVSTASPGGAVLNNHKTAPLDITWCQFKLNKNTAANSAACLAVQYASSLTTVTLTDFERTEGVAVRVNNSTRSSGGETILSNNTFIYQTADYPAAYVGGSTSYTAPSVTFVNNLMAYNKGNDLEVARGILTGSNNYAFKVQGVTLDNPVADNGKDIFLLHDDKTTVPYRNSANNLSYLINPEGPAHGTGIESFTSQLGKESVFMAKGSLRDDDAMCIGSSSDTDYMAGVDDIKADNVSDSPSLHVWPNPATDHVNVDGTFDRLFISNMAGVTVYVGNARTIDVSNLQRGLYIVSAEYNGKITTSKLIVK